MEINKENSVLDLSKCTEEERKSLPQILEKARQEIYFLAKPTLLSGKLDLYYPYLVFSRPSSNVWVFSHNKPDRTELTYPEFIKLFEGAESKEVLQVENNGWISVDKKLPSIEGEYLTYKEVEKKVKIQPRTT